jgi:hypothetical protein
MARIPLLCPIDGTNLGAANTNITPTFLGDVARDQDSHLHLRINARLTCSNGHTWEIVDGDIVLQRVS